MCPADVQDLVFQWTDDKAKYEDVKDKITALAQNRAATARPTPMEVDNVREEEYEKGAFEDEWDARQELEVDYVGESCLHCGGMGHYARECPTPKGKGKGSKGDGKRYSKGSYKGDGKSGYKGDYKGGLKGGYKGGFKGDGYKNDGKGKGGKGFSGACWQCGQAGHRAWECPKNSGSGGGNMEIGAVGEEMSASVGGVWAIAAVETEEWTDIARKHSKNKDVIRAGSFAGVVCGNRFQALGAHEEDDDQNDDDPKFAIDATGAEQNHSDQKFAIDAKGAEQNNNHQTMAIDEAGTEQNHSDQKFAMDATGAEQNHSDRNFAIGATVAEQNHDDDEDVSDAVKKQRKVKFMGAYGKRVVDNVQWNEVVEVCAVPFANCSVADTTCTARLPPGLGVCAVCSGSRAWRKIGTGEITVDSAAEESVCPKDWCPEFGTRSPAKWLKFVNASGGQMGHYGERTANFQVTGKEAAVMSLNFQVSDVQKPLAAVRRITEKGNVVQFGPKDDDNFIKNSVTGAKIMMVKKGGSYIIPADMLVEDLGFAGRAQ
jgi:hypothetical protein